MAAAAVGGAVFAGTGPRGAVGLLTFFVSSPVLGRLPRAKATRQRRGDERDAVQVIANGGVAAALALTLACRQDAGSPSLLAGFAGALAAATADTWATEIGSRFGDRPRSIVSGTPVAPGASGGVTAAGLLASAAGAAAIAAVVTIGASGKRRSLAPAIVAAGVAGALVDSILGATIQEVRWCATCRAETELPRHACGAATTVVRGVPRFDNDAVNAAATLTGALAATAMHRFSIGQTGPPIGGAIPIGDTVPFPHSDAVGRGVLRPAASPAAVPSPIPRHPAGPPGGNR